LESPRPSDMSSWQETRSPSSMSDRSHQLSDLDLLSDCSSITSFTDDVTPSTPGRRSLDTCNPWSPSWKRHSISWRNANPQLQVHLLQRVFTTLHIASNDHSQLDLTGSTGTKANSVEASSMSRIPMARCQR
jgi:hypothetical protein